jgi:hypothetical protein
MDAYAKTVLTVIAACLLLQVAQGFGLAGAAGPDPAGAGAGERYVVQPVPMIRLLLRIDRATGRTWSMPLQLDKERFWTPIEDAPPEPMAGEERAPSPPEEGGANEE